MSAQRSWLNPPQTNHERPTERKFYIWQERHIDYSGSSRFIEGKWGRHPWRWMCTMCDPPAYGFRARVGAFEAIVRITLPRHMEHRRYHHQWARSKPVGR